MSTVVVLAIMAIGTPLIFKYLPNEKNNRASFNVELKAREYIEQHSKNYSKENIQKALVSVGVDPQDAKTFVNKYYLEN